MNDEIEIRAMKKSDIEDALKLWRTAFNAGFSESFDTKEILIRYLERNPGLSSVAYNNDKLIGALMCGHDGRRGSIYHTAVNMEYRFMGVGKRMEERSLGELKKQGITTGFLFINIKNAGSGEFWSSIGWTEIPDVRYLYKEF